MAKLKRLSPAEWEIMDAIWNLGGAPSVREVLDHLFPAGEKAYTTVQTLMTILVKKGFLETRKIGLVNFFTPKVTRAEIVTVETRDMVSRLFRGSVPSLASHLLETDSFSLQELAEIKKLLEKKECELKGTK